MKDLANMKLPPALSQFDAALRLSVPGVVVSFDAPLRSDGEWWADIKVGKFSTAVAWRAGQGFGVFTSEPGYGDKPDEIYRNSELACHRVRQLADIFNRNGEVQPTRLRDMRILLGERQEVLAGKMHITQTALSKFEKRSDVRLSTVAAYVGALGGRVEMRVVFPDFEASVPVSPEEIAVES